MKKLFALVIALLLCLTACGKPSTTSDNMTAEDFAEDCTYWMGSGGNELTVDTYAQKYLYRTWYGRTGAGELVDDDGGLELKFSTHGADYYYYFVRSSDGFTLRHTGGGEGTEYGELNGMEFVPTQSEPSAYEPSLLNGVWQNANGETLAFNTDSMRVIRCSALGTMSSEALYDDDGGMGIYLGGEEILYPCLSSDGDAFVLFTAGNKPRESGAYDTGVFYRNGDVKQYAELEKAQFEQSDDRMWYYDGARYIAMPAGYTIENGVAYDEYGMAFAPDWPDVPFDPATVWGDNWLEDNWG